VDSYARKHAETDFIKNLSTGGKNVLRPFVSGRFAQQGMDLSNAEKFEIIIGFPDLQGSDIWK